MNEIDSIVGNLSESMPEVSEHAILEAQEQERKNQANSEENVINNALPPSGDSFAISPSGEKYDPKTQKVSEKTGKIIKKSSGVSGSKSKVVAKNTPPAAPTQANPEAAARATGKVAAAFLINLGVGVFGDEFLPEKTEVADERAYLENAFGEYFIATGRTELPPIWALSVAIGAYTLPRFTRPKTRSKLAAVRDWAIGKFFAWRSKKQLKEAVKNAQE